MASLLFSAQSAQVWVAAPPSGRCTSVAQAFQQRRSAHRPETQRRAVVASAAAPAAPAAPATVPWYERPAPPNVKHITTVQEMVDELAAAREQLVVADFFAPWCGACRSLYPKLCKLAAEHPDVVFLCINFDESRTLAKGLNVRVLPYFHFYRGAEGRVAAFSASVSKVQLLRDAIKVHNTPRCSLPQHPTGLEEFPDVVPGSPAAAAGAAGGSSSFSCSIEGLPSRTGDAACDFCGPPNGTQAGQQQQAPPIVAGPFDGDALMM